MKIAIQGQIVDTDNIHSIDERVRESKNTFCFDIIFFNDLSITVGIETNDRNNNAASDECRNVRDTMSGNLTTEEISILNSILKNVPIINKEKIERMRQDIVNIWSENQSKIPSFDINKY